MNETATFFFKGDSLGCNKQQMNYKSFFQAWLELYVGLHFNFRIICRHAARTGEVTNKKWFIEDGARHHSINHIFRFLEEDFVNRLFELDYCNFIDSGLEWPPYLLDLNAFDYLWWGALKNCLYQKIPRHWMYGFLSRGFFFCFTHFFLIYRVFQKGLPNFEMT